MCLFVWVLVVASFRAHGACAHTRRSLIYWTLNKKKGKKSLNILCCSVPREDTPLPPSFLLPRTSFTLFPDSFRYAPICTQDACSAVCPKDCTFLANAHARVKAQIGFAGLLQKHVLAASVLRALFSLKRGGTDFCLYQDTHLSVYEERDYVYLRQMNMRWLTALSKKSLVSFRHFRWSIAINTFRRDLNSCLVSLGEWWTLTSALMTSLVCEMRKLNVG